MNSASNVIIDSKNYEKLYGEILLRNIPSDVEMSNLDKKYSTCGLVDSKLVENLWNFVHKSGLERPDILVKCGIFLLTSQYQFSSLDQHKMVCFETFRVALLLNNKVVVDACLEIISKEYPSKFHEMEGLYLESLDKIEEAKDVYADILAESPSDQFVLQRKVGMYLSYGMTNSAIASLNDFLKIYCNDMDAYQQLVNIYLSLREYKKAGFCAEELILSNPYQYLYHLQYAEILYTMGDYNLARKYFMHCHSLNPDCARALYGILLTAPLCKDKNTNEAMEKELLTLYTKKAGPDSQITTLLMKWLVSK